MHLLARVVAMALTSSRLELNAAGRPLFQGVDAKHAVRGLTLRNFTVGGARLIDLSAAERIAHLTVGPFVEGVVIE